MEDLAEAFPVWLEPGAGVRKALVSVT
jgi:hypothetical protein